MPLPNNREKLKKSSGYLLGLIGIFMMTSSMAELIVLASPPQIDHYYDKEQDKIINFQINYAKKIMRSGDDIVILSTKKLYKKYADALGDKRVIIAPMWDIWMRDFTLVNPGRPIMFRYTAAGQGGGKKGQIQADEVQNIFYQLAKKASLQFKESNLLNDGGNFVDDYTGNVVISTKFLRDNHLSERQAREKLGALTRATHIAFIEADEQGGLEHADGIVSFVGTNTLVINSYHEDRKYAEQLTESLRNQLPGVKIYELSTPYDGSHIYDRRFGSACGLYTNMLVTKKRIYFPQFGIPEDKPALKQIRSITTRTVIPVLSSQICDMGGGVRCISLQLRGENARRLLTYARDQKK